jgi:hypothetical protein
MDVYFRQSIDKLLDVLEFVADICYSPRGGSLGPAIGFVVDSLILRQASFGVALCSQRYAFSAHVVRRRRGRAVSHDERV